ncbi:hypothetical protein WA158_003097 [Blastocystis sp. Blastoise]
MDHRHRSSALKQSNKAHKSQKSTKRQITGQFAGRVENNTVSIKQRISLKSNRMNTMKQQRENKMREAIKQKRSGAGYQYPIIVAIIPLSAKARPEAVNEYILNQQPDAIYESELGEGVFGKPTTMLFSRLKKRITTIVCPHDLESIIDTVKVADVCVFVVSANGEENEIMDETGDLYISTVRGQGLPTSVGFIQDLELIPIKQRNDKKKLASRILQAEIGIDAHIYDESSKNNFMRGLCECTIKPIAYRNIRSYMLVDKVLVEEEREENLDISFSGYIRGMPLTVHDLIHLTSSATYQQGSITIHDDPCPVTKSHASVDPMEHNNSTLVALPEYTPSLAAEAPYDPSMAGEQTWPTDEELHLYDDVPQMEGVSSAQADWLHTLNWDKEGNDDDNYDEEEDNDNDNDSTSENQGMIEEESTMKNDIHFEENDTDLADLALLNEEKEDTTTEEYRKRDEQEHTEFPDEVEVPLNIAARKRFMKYRGLQSFRSSPWDANENLPVDYATLFKLENYNVMEKHVLEQYEERKNKVDIGQFEIIPEKEEEEEEEEEKEMVDDESTYKDRLVPEGTYITIVLKNVEKRWVYTHKLSCPILLSSVLKYEEKLSVIHMSIQRTDSWYSDTVKSKDLLSLHVGFRKILIHPLYNNPVLGSTKAKFNRYLTSGDFMYATCYAPICYKPCPVLLFKPRTDFSEPLIPVALGSVNTVDPDRVLLKRIILTGYPLKVRRRVATVRHMFYDPKDIEWFKPVELYTKYGRVGHIKESLGTHGYMKCLFNEPVTMQDTVCLALYKRVFPKKPTQEEEQQFL